MQDGPASLEDQCLDGKGSAYLRYDDIAAFCPDGPVDHQDIPTEDAFHFHGVSTASKAVGVCLVLEQQGIEIKAFLPAVLGRGGKATTYGLKEKGYV